MGVMVDISPAHVSRVLGKHYIRSRTSLTGSGFQVTAPARCTHKYGTEVYVRRVGDKPSVFMLEQYATALRQAGYAAVIKGDTVVVTHVPEKEN